MESDHTPGPWKNVLYDHGDPIAHAGNWLVIGPDDEVVADPRGGPERSDAEVKANGDLIARAPEMADRIRGLEAKVERLVAASGHSLVHQHFARVVTERNEARAEVERLQGDPRLQLDADSLMVVAATLQVAGFQVLADRFDHILATLEEKA